MQMNACCGLHNKANCNEQAFTKAQKIRIFLFAGWRPKRTLIFASFAARNYGNLGATKWLDVRNKLYIINI